jgi:hypothetical protein
MSLGFTSYATTYYVNAAQPSDSDDGRSWTTAKRTIQAAVDEAIDGDSVLVTNGIYNVGVRVTPNWSVKNRLVITNNITVASVSGAAVTVIEGSGISAYGTTNAVRCVYMNNGVLDGFTLRSGATYSHVMSAYGGNKGGGAVNMIGAAAGTEVRNCIIRDNKAYDGGGVATGYGFTCGWVVNCLITGNSACYGGATYWTVLQNCTVVGNSASLNVAGTYCGAMTNSIVYGNSGNSGNHLSCTANYSCTVPLPSGIGNIAVSPLFVDGAGPNYRLLAASPCINAGDNTYVISVKDLDGNPRIAAGKVDIGAYECVLDEYTLTVDSVHGGVSPGTLTAGCGSALSLCVTNSPLDCGTMQYVCTGAAVSGNAFTQTSSTNVTLTLTNNAVLAWQWETNSWLEVASTGHGVVTSGGWYAPGSSVQISAQPEQGYRFAGWSDGVTNVTRWVTVPLEGAIFMGNFIAIPRGGLRLTCDEATVSEGAIVLKLTVERVNGSYGDASVCYEAESGTAAEGVDYALDLNMLQWRDGESGTKSFYVDIIDDGVFEGNEAFSIRLTDARGADLAIPSAVSVTITDNEEPPLRVARLVGTLDFGGVPTNLMVSLPVEVWNDGNQALSVTNIALPSCFTAEPRLFAVPAGGVVTVSVLFAPLEVLMYSGSLSLSCDATGGSISTAVSGVGVVPSQSPATRKIVGLTAAIAVIVPDHAAALGVEDELAPGLTPSGISDGGTWDALNRKVKWFFNEPGQVRSRVLQYTVDAVGVVVTGLVSFGTANIGVEGDTVFAGGANPGLLHPADDNGDWRLVLNEVAANVARWRNGLDDTKTPVVVRGITLYLQGERYRYDPLVPAEAKRWVPILALPSAVDAAFSTRKETVGAALSVYPLTAERCIAVTNIMLIVTPGVDTAAWGLEESIPAGLVVTGISDGGSWDSIHRKIKWSFFDGLARTLTYNVTGKAGHCTTIDGDMSFDGSEDGVSGNTMIAIPLPFQTWAAQHGLSGPSEEVFNARNPEYGLPNGLVYALQPALQPGTPVITIAWVDGRPVIEMPAQNPATVDYVTVFPVGTEDLALADWSLVLEPVAAQPGTSTGRSTWEPRLTSNRAFFKVQASLR